MKIKLNKEKLLIITVILTITVICVFSLFTNKLYVHDDSTFHINRIIGLANAFEERQILPKIYPYANNGFGYATPLFYCDLFLYPFGILHHFGVGAVLCYKLAIIFYVLVGNIITYYVIKRITNNDLMPIVGLALYAFSNYHLQNLLLRSAFGEILAMSFLPLVILAIYEILINHKDSWILLGVSFSLIVLSHLISTLLVSVFFATMIIAWITINIKDKNIIFKGIKTILKGTILALLLTAWYLFPMIEQLMDQTFWLSINAKSNDLSLTTQNIQDVFNIFACIDLTQFSIYRQASTGMSIVLSSVAYIFVKKNKYITIVFVYSLILIIITLGILPYSYLNIIQFLFRNYIVITALLTIVSIYAIMNINIKYRKAIAFMAVSLSIVNSLIINIQVLNNGKLYLSNDATKEEINSIDSYRYNINYNHDELGGADYLPYSEGYINYNEETPAIKYIDKSGNKIDSIWDYNRNFTRIEFECDYDEDKTLIIPMSYYKGYKGYELIDNQYKEIDLYDYEEFKELAIDSLSGYHVYMVKYEGTVIQKITLIISNVSLIGLIIYVVKKKEK